MKDLDIMKLNKDLQKTYNELMFNKLEAKTERMDMDIQMLDKENLLFANLIHEQDKQIKRIALAQIFLTVAFVIGALIVGLWLGN